MPQGGFEPTIPAKTAHALDGAATVIGNKTKLECFKQGRTEQDVKLFMALEKAEYPIVLKAQALESNKCKETSRENNRRKSTFRRHCPQRQDPYAE
jgi:hypothetical protein